jgi:hypothetical protein
MGCQSSIQYFASDQQIRGKKTSKKEKIKNVHELVILSGGLEALREACFVEVKERISSFVYFF